MLKQYFSISGVPAVLFGEAANRLYLYIHGQGGNKEEAAAVAEVACPRGYQVMGVDMPCHGERTGDADTEFVPWKAIPELQAVMSYIKARWQKYSLFANSIGAWFSLLGLAEEAFQKCLLLSPVVDMGTLVYKMMGWAGVSEDELQKKRTIKTDFGQTLSWDYLTYIKAHPIAKWTRPTALLYAEHDNLVDMADIERFSEKFGCTLTVMPNGEHWFHTDEQLAFMKDWAKGNL